MEPYPTTVTTARYTYISTVTHTPSTNCFLHLSARSWYGLTMGWRTSCPPFPNSNSTRGPSGRVKISHVTSSMNASSFLTHLFVLAGSSIYPFSVLYKNTRFSVPSQFIACSTVSSAILHFRQTKSLYL